MLIENEKVQKIQTMGLIHQTLAAEKQGLTTMEIWLVTVPPGVETPVARHFGEVVIITLKGTGQAIIGDDQAVDLFPNTTLVIPPQVPRHLVNTGGADLVFLAIRSLVPPREKTVAEVMAGRA